MSQTSLVPYQYIWRDYSQTSYQSLILTLNNYQLLLLLAFLSVLVAYTQTRWWIISRYLLIRILRPVQLPNSDDAMSLHHLTQARAIKLLIFKDKRRDSDSMTSISPFFGAVSIFNVLLFVVLGTIVPYYLTGGSGPAKVLSQTTASCNGFEAYSSGALELANTFYAKCQLDPSKEASTCRYLMRIVNDHPQISLTVDTRCPFAENICEPDVGNKSLRIEYLDMTPSDYGLNANWKIRQSHRLTCTPVKVRWFELSDVNATVFWVGYSSSEFNVNSTHASIGEAIRYWPNNLEQPGPLNFKSFTRYERRIYPGMGYRMPFEYIENFHPDLNSNGDTYITLLKQGIGIPGSTPFYSPWREANLSHGLDETFNYWGASTYAIGCIEQYKLCFDSTCTRWSNATTAMHTLFQLLHADYDQDIMSGVLEVQNLLIQASTLRNFMQFHFRQPLMARYMWMASEELRLISENSPNEQWQWEVQSWFEMAFLITRFSFLTSTLGEKQYSDVTWGNFTNTGWICNKAFFLDNDFTNINYTGLLSIIASILVLCLIALTAESPEWHKSFWGVLQRAYQWAGCLSQRIWCRIEAAFRGLWKDMLHDLSLRNTLIQELFQNLIGSYRTIFPPMTGRVTLLPRFPRLPTRHLSAYFSRNSSYQDDGSELDSSSFGYREDEFFGRRNQ